LDGIWLPCRRCHTFSKYGEKPVKYFKKRNNIILIYMLKTYFGYLCVENELENRGDEAIGEQWQSSLMTLLSSWRRNTFGLLPFKRKDSCLLQEDRGS
jgi:hypothetical protein